MTSIASAPRYPGIRAIVEDDRLANWRGLQEFAGMRAVATAKK